jgi:hypothetical protein
MMMTRHKQKLIPVTPIIILLVVLMMAFLSAEASGQGRNDQTETELERTDRILADAGELLTETNNPQAEQLLAQALDLQDRGWEAFRAGRHGQAMQFTQNARNIVTKALGLLHRRQEDYSFVEKEIERTDALLDRARGYLAEAETDRGTLILDQAGALQEKARDLMTERHLKQSLAFTLRARRMLQNIVDEVGGPGRRVQMQQRTMDRASQMLDDNRELITNSGDDKAIALFQQAEREYDQAKELAVHQQRWGQVNRLLEASVTDVNKALRLVRGEDAATTAKNALQQADDRLSRLTEKARESGTGSADNLLNEAKTKLDKAHTFFDQADYDRVLVVVRVVMELEQQAARILGAW